MLTPEQAQQRLRAAQIPDLLQWRIEAIRKLSDAPLSEKIHKLYVQWLKEDVPVSTNLQTIAFGLIGHVATGKPIRSEQDAHYMYGEHSRAVYNGSMAALAALEPENRIQIFQVFFRKIAAHIEQLWQFVGKLPYQIGYTRKAFRAPSQDELYASMRANSFHQYWNTLGAYDKDIIWYTEHGAYIGRGYHADTLGRLLAAVIDAGGKTGDEVFNILLASARGEHETGAMGRHVTRALLIASRVDGWEYVEKLLLAAQREEGLRQAVLEAVDEAHPEAFRRILHIIQEHDLSRFSAVTRGVNVWLGYGWDSENTRIVNATIGQLLVFLENESARREALQNGGGEAVYLALWTIALKDAFAAIEAAVPLLNDEDIERRFAAAQLLSFLGLEAANRALIPAMADRDLRVALTACYSLYSVPSDAGVFEAVEALLSRLPIGKTVPAFEALVWPWRVVELNIDRVAQILLHALEDRSPKRLIPHLEAFTGYNRVHAIQNLVTVGLDDPEIRDIVFKALGERNQYLRSEVLKILDKQTVQPAENLYLESLLTRKSDDLRRGVLTLLSHQPDAESLASADRLIASGKVDQRLAGWGLVQLLHQAGRESQACVNRAIAYGETKAKLTDAEKNLIESITHPQAEQPTLANALGLMNPANRTSPTPPIKRNVQITSKAAVASLLSLDALIHEHRQTSIVIGTWQGENQEALLGNVGNGFPQTKLNEPVEEDAQRLPLRQIWEDWVEKRSGDLLDDDGLELVRARILLHRYNHEQNFPFLEALNAEDNTQLKLNYRPLIHILLLWLTRLYPAPNTSDFLIDTMETVWAGLSAEAFRKQDVNYRFGGWHAHHSAELAILGLARNFRATVGSDWEDRHHLRLWGLLRWMDEPFTDVPRLRPELEEVLTVYQLKAATVDDIYDQLLGPRMNRNGWQHFEYLQQLSGKNPSTLFQEYPILRDVFERCHERILEVELQRGDMPNEATNAANALRSVPGTNWFIRILQALGKGDISREHYGQSRSISLSRLLHVSYPTVDETPDSFAKAVKKAAISDERLVESAVYAPQWASLVEHTLRWKGLADAIWWLHAHTKDNQWRVAQEVRDEWAASINARTPLSSRDLLEGAVDIDWFWRVYKALGATRWETVYNAAKYSSSGIGHNRSKQFADAMLGNLDQQALLKRILEKRHQDSVRALGLLPLPKRKREDEILNRYQTMQEFLRGSHKFGPQRRESEKLAVQIAMENLARAAEYPDPARLGWAMEARAVADLRDGAIRETVDDVTLTLSIDLLGKPQLSIERAGKAIKSLPAKMKKQPDFVALRERKTQIEQQHSRMRVSLETTMCKGDAFTGKELVTLLEHPVLAPMLEQLIFVGDEVIGYPAEGGRGLMRHDGTIAEIAAGTALRIAHAYDLFKTGEWHLWQRECFLAERIQPFKQVFRELYLLTEAERQEGAISRRYAGHQVQPRQAIALLGARGWIAHQDYGVQKTFHRQDFSAHINFLGGYFSPAEVEGLTLEGVLFTKSGQWKPMQLEELPTILFSEVMRDLDLVVSVAHRGGVDPEATASTVEMRTTLIRETCDLLKVDNVQLEGSHALIEGKLGSYSVHLGSAIVHRQPGGALCIIPVHAQHRGRIFLPFADDDPKTAEVISKVLLLARDSDIKDPTILEQIFARG